MEESVLIVEDEMVSLTRAQTGLNAAGIVTHTAQNGAIALDILAKHLGIGTILLDWVMPVMDGPTFLNNIKADPRYKDIPVIMVTGQQQVEKQVTSFEAGVYQYFVKPVPNELMVAVVKQALDSYRNLLALKDEKESIREFALTRIERERQKASVDTSTLRAINEFYASSLNAHSYEELCQLLVVSVHTLKFDSAAKEGEPEEFKQLRCSIRSRSGQEVDLSDRGVSSKLDSMILENCLAQTVILHQGTYTAIPSKSGQVAVLIRNTPEATNEKLLAIYVISSLVEQFEERLLAFAAQEDMVRQHQQMRLVVSASTQEFRLVKKTYQSLKETQMDQLEALEQGLLERAATLPKGQQEDLKGFFSAWAAQAFQLFSKEEVADQKFLVNIEKLNDLLTGQSNAVALEPGQFGGVQSEIDRLLANLGRG